MTRDVVRWQTRAACKDIHIEIFYPPLVDSYTGKKCNPNSEDYDTAREICAICTVREDCLAYALETRQEYGMWGGTTPRDRYVMLNKNRIDVVFKSKDPPPERIRCMTCDAFMDAKQKSIDSAIKIWQKTNHWHPEPASLVREQLILGRWVTMNKLN